MENYEQIKQAFHEEQATGSNHLNEDKLKQEQQNIQMDRTAYPTDFLLNQLMQQWQQERLEVRQDLMFICQYLRGLAERQEQQWHQIQYNHNQIISETRQHFQVLSLLISTPLSQDNSAHIFSSQENQQKDELPKPNTHDEQMISQRLENSHQDSADEQRTFSSGSQNLVNSDHNMARAFSDSQNVTNAYHNVTRAFSSASQNITNADHNVTRAFNSDSQNITNADHNVTRAFISGSQNITTNAFISGSQNITSADHNGTRAFNSDSQNITNADHNVTRTFISGSQNTTSADYNVTRAFNSDSQNITSVDHNVTRAFISGSQNVTNTDHNVTRAFGSSSHNITNTDHNMATNVETNSLVESLVSEQIHSLSEINAKEENIQSNHKQDVSDASLDLETYEQTAFHLNEQYVASEISSKPEENESNKYLSNTRGHNEEYHGKTNYEKNMVVSNHDYRKGEMKTKTQPLEKQNTKPWNNSERTFMSEFPNKSEKETGGAKGSKEQIKFSDQNISRKMYADAVITGQNLPVSLKIDSSSKEEYNTSEMPIHAMDILGTEESYEGTGIYADAISKLMNKTVPSPVSHAKMSASSAGQAYYKGTIRNNMSKSETTDFKTMIVTPKNTKENRTRNQSKFK